MESALELAGRQARDAGARRIVTIRLRIGALSGVVPEALEFAFESLAPGTLAEGARLDIERVMPRFVCDRCREEFETEDLFGPCPRCQESARELRAGREMELASLEIE